jgi:NAD(P)H-quinone oxidoreductase subunit 4
MYSGQLGVFAVQDMLLFFFMWELELIPVYLLLSIWAWKKRLYAATKFILYTAGGSLFILVAALAMAFYGDTIQLRHVVRWRQRIMPLNFQLFMYAAFLIAYAVKLPIFPLHTWLPDAHGEATAPVHMLLAGIFLKDGRLRHHPHECRHVAGCPWGICTRVWLSSASSTSSMPH